MSNKSVKRTLMVAICGFALISTSIAALLFVPPLRDWFFTTAFWPWALPCDTNERELQHLKDLARPGDIVVEANLHLPQWIVLCQLMSGTDWVHAALVDEKKTLITVEKKTIQTPFDIYAKWKSTRLAIVRPSYRDQQQVQKVIAYACSKLGDPYDPSFDNQAGNCSGLVGSALAREGVPVKSQDCFGHQIYAPDCFFKIPGAQVIWTSDRDRGK